MPSSRYNSELVSVGYGTPPDHVMRKKKYTYYLKIRLIPLDRFLLEMSTSTTLQSPALNKAVLQKNRDCIGVTVAFKCKKESKKESVVLSNNALYNAYIFDAAYHLFMISDVKPSSKQKNQLAWLATNTTDQVSAYFLIFRVAEVF